MNRFYSLLCALIAGILLAAPCEAAALSLSQGGGGSVPQGEITEIDSSYLPKYGIIGGHPSAIFEVGCAPQDIISTLPDCVDGIIGETGAYVPCSVEWNLPDTSIPGWVDITGTLSPPPGCTLAPGLTAVSYPVMLNQAGMQNPEMLSGITLSNDQRESYIAQLLPEGSNLSDLSFLSYSATAVCQNGLYYEFPVDWDLSSVDPSTPGEYTVTGMPQLPSCFLVPDGFTGLKATVYIGSSDGINLSAITRKSLTSVTSEWIEVIPDPENMHLYYSIGSEDGPFLEDQPESIGSIADGTKVTTSYGWYTGNRLSISLGNLQVGIPYYFYIEYHGEKSNLLSVTAMKNELPNASGIGGDRDGSDREPQATPTPSASPAPSASSEPDQNQETSLSHGSEAPSATAAPARDQEDASSTSTSETPVETESVFDASPTYSAESEHTSKKASESSESSAQPDGQSSQNASPALFPWQLIIIFAAAAGILAVLLFWRYHRYGS